MNLEISTVKTSQGEVLEKNVITGAHLDLTNDTISLHNTNVVVRKDGAEVSGQLNASIQIGGIGVNNFTPAEVSTILEARDAFIDVIAEILNSKVQILPTQEEE